MPVLATILLLQPQAVDEDAWALKLGKERTQFGDIPNSGLWKHGDVGQFGGTYILFRAGSSTERYYYTTAAGSGSSRISRETKVGGKIRKDWMIFLSEGKEPRIKKPGPLWLYAGGGKISGSIPKRALADLQNPVPLAIYHANVHYSYCAFTLPDGKLSPFLEWEAGTITADGGYSYGMLPKASKPYPITPEERAWKKGK
ncbi:MAG TPA: hypothetical protein VJ835_04910 [Fimbriimonadaceae bacterium]|nr:hypothetical protein [Fimbriimonadaceae bacterium]